MEPRIPPVTDLDALDPEARQIIARTEMDGRVLNIFRTFVRHPKLLKRWLVFGNHILAKSSLSPRDREILILRTAHRCGSTYEWAQHVPIGLASGLTQDEIDAIAAGTLDDVLLRTADELIDDHVLGDETWAALRERYDEKQLLDAIFTVGQYAMLAGALNSLRVPLEES